MAQATHRRSPKQQAEAKRLTIRIPEILNTALFLHAARRKSSINALVTDWLTESWAEPTKQPPRAPRRPRSRAMAKALYDHPQRGQAAGSLPERQLLARHGQAMRAEIQPFLVPVGVPVAIGLVAIAPVRTPRLHPPAVRQ